MDVGNRGRIFGSSPFPCQCAVVSLGMGSLSRQELRCLAQTFVSVVPALRSITAALRSVPSPTCREANVQKEPPEEVCDLHCPINRHGPILCCSFRSWQFLKISLVPSRTRLPNILSLPAVALFPTCRVPLDTKVYVALSAIHPTDTNAGDGESPTLLPSRTGNSVLGTRSLFPIKTNNAIENCKPQLLFFFLSPQFRDFSHSLCPFL